MIDNSKEIKLSIFDRIFRTKKWEKEHDRRAIVSYAYYKYIVEGVYFETFEDAYDLANKKILMFQLNDPNFVYVYCIEKYVKMYETQESEIKEWLNGLKRKKEN